MAPTVADDNFKYIYVDENDISFFINSFIPPPCKLLNINAVHVQNLNSVAVVPADVQTPSCVNSLRPSDAYMRP